MQIFEVGGAVRDALLKRPIHDRDYVVVGARPEDMIAQGFVPVGKDFPVFLHPKTHQEYALARTERKTAPGYTGFQIFAAPDVTLEEDLARRDLTINAMARAQTGQIIDPYGGQRDIASRTLRHVSPAFSEDPVRILRLARFAARFPDFSVAPETQALMVKMVDSGEVDALVPERVWQELSRALMETAPARFFEILRTCGALKRLMPELDSLFGIPQRPDYHPEIDAGLHTLLCLNSAAQAKANLNVRWATLLHDLGKGLTPCEKWPNHQGHEAAGLPLVRAVCKRIKAPRTCEELAMLVTSEHLHIHNVQSFSASTLVKLLMRCDALRRPDRFEDVLLACQCDTRGRTGFEQAPYPQANFLRHALTLIRQVDARAIAQSGSPDTISDRLYTARIEALKHSHLPLQTE